MARPQTNKVDYFPEWNPNKATRYKLDDYIDSKEALKIFRNSSSGFISKPIVRDFIFNRDNSTCVLCSATNNLQVDHIKSVRHCFNNNLLWECNKEDNLQTLCLRCNAAKTP